jgi:hypothetical protein
VKQRWAASIDLPTGCTGFQSVPLRGGVENPSYYLGLLRGISEIDVCQQQTTLWLRGWDWDVPLQQALRKIPGAVMFEVLADEQLLPAGKRVPRGKLPAGPWMAIADWIVPVVPAASLGGRDAARVPLHLVRATQLAEADVVLLSAATWRDYALQAPQIRLNCWSFALREDGCVCVRGAPPPPLPGEWFVELEGLAVPAGWQWWPPVEPAVLRQVFQFDAGDLLLLHLDGTHQRIAAADFVRAARSAVRLSTGQGT